MRNNEPVTLPKRADAVVIGGGVVGTAVAHQLAEAGLSTVLVEAAELAHGASGRNAGMVYQGSSIVDGRSTIPLTVLTNHLLDEYTRRWGFSAFEYERCGDLDLVLDTGDPHPLEQNVEGANRLGLPVEMIDGDRARELVPSLSRRVVAARYYPTDARILPYKLAFAQARAARQAGALIATWTRVVGIDVSEQRVRAVRTNRGRIATDWVVNAANAWAPEIAALAGIHGLPIEPWRGQILVTVPAAPSIPMNLCMRGEYWRQTAGGQIVLGGGLRRDANYVSYRRRVDPIAVHTYTVSAAEATPLIRRLPVVRMWAGIMGFTPDHNPIVGLSSTHGGFVYACGFNGVGNAYSAGTGRVVTELILGKPPSVCLDGAAPRRFGL